MVIKNRTRYRTADLTRLFRDGAREVGLPRTPLDVQVVYSRNGSVTGCAWLPRRGEQYGRRVRMRLPRNPGHLNMKELAQVWFHELQHVMGLRHREMKKWFALEVHFHEGLTVGVQDDAPKPGRSERMGALVQRRADKAKRRVAALEAKLFRTERLLKKWRARVAYYEKKGVTP